MTIKKIIQISFKQLMALTIFYSISPLIIAYISEYYFDYKPCKLCIYQRLIYFIMIILCFLSIKFIKHQKKQKISIFLLVTITFFEFLVAGYHSGIEAKIFSLPSGCKSNNSIDYNQTTESLAQILKDNSFASCDVPTAFFLGMSMASWNAIYSLFLLISIIASYSYVNFKKL